MADNDGNGVRGEVVDGVDPNRNHATHWGLDNEGSSDSLISETYRGTGPDSEPETKAIKLLWNHVDFAFQKNDHTAAELLLWPNGFQQYTPTPDDKLFEAYAGDDANSAIADKEFNADDRGVGDHRQPLRPRHRRRALHHQRRPDRRRVRRGHPGLHAGGLEPNIPNVSGFEFQDVEADIEAEFQRHRLFALDLARIRRRPGEPEPPMTRTHWATRSRTSTSSPSRTPTATRSPSRSWPRSRWATSSCATASTTAR